jgi:hypothetical protein
MFKNEKLTKEVLAKIVKAEKKTLDAMTSTRVEHEPSITDRLLANIEYGLDGHEIAGVEWEAKTLTSIGKKSQEVRHGADFVAVLNLNLPGYKVSKGFLAQAKRLEPGQNMSSHDYKDLIDQCNKMHNISPVSYVFIYSKQSGIRVVSAVDILSADTCNPLTLETWSLKEFFEAHIQCFIGDFRVNAANSYELEALAADVRARNGIILAGRNNLDGSYRNVIR